MKREIFSRPTRMAHQFEQLVTRGDPLEAATFEMDWPRRVDDLSKRAAGRPCTSQDYGQHNDRPDPSPVVKPNGSCARMDGPSPDYAMIEARPIPVGTKRRLGPLKTDK